MRACAAQIKLGRESLLVSQGFLHLSTVLHTMIKYPLAVGRIPEDVQSIITESHIREGPPPQNTQAYGFQLYPSRWLLGWFKWKSTETQPYIPPFSEEGVKEPTSPLRPGHAAPDAGWATWLYAWRGSGLGGVAPSFRQRLAFFLEGTPQNAGVLLAFPWKATTRSTKH